MAFWNAFHYRRLWYVLRSILSLVRVQVWSLTILKPSGTKPLTPFGKFHSILRFLGCPVPKTWKRYSSARDNKDPVAFVDFMVDYVVDLDYIQQQEAGDIEKNQSEKVAERSESLHDALGPS